MYIAADAVHPTLLDDEMLGALPPSTASFLLSRVSGFLLVVVIGCHGALSSGLSNVNRLHNEIRWERIPN